MYHYKGHNLLSILTLAAGYLLVFELRRPGTKRRFEVPWLGAQHSIGLSTNGLHLCSQHYHHDTVAIRVHRVRQKLAHAAGRSR